LGSTKKRLSYALSPLELSDATTWGPGSATRPAAKEEAQKVVDRLGKKWDERGLKSFNVNSSKLLKSSD